MPILGVLKNKDYVPKASFVGYLLTIFKMSNRKEDLKKSLGISEYPRSSDDDDDDDNEQPVPDIRPRANTESQPSGANLPGSSGIQSQSEHTSPAARKRQTKVDRDLFWSIINHTNRCVRSINPPVRCRSSESIPRLQRHVAQPPRTALDLRIPAPRPVPRRTERPPSSMDGQRVMVLKKLARNVHSLPQSRSDSNTAHTCRSPLTLFPIRTAPILPTAQPSRPCPASHRQLPTVPSYPTPRAAQPQTLMRSSSQPLSIAKMFGLQWKVETHPWVLATDSNRTNASNLNDEFMDDTPARQMWCRRTELELMNTPDEDGAGPSQAPDFHATDVGGAGNSAIPRMTRVPRPLIDKTKPRDESTENSEENAEEATLDNASGARLIEEVLEVEPHDETDNNPPPPGTEPDERPEPTNTEDNTAKKSKSDDYASRHGTKRKREREPSCSTNDSYSIQYYNKCLLRLLECPVCLDWMEPPISQCRRGHLVCSRCRVKLAACPVCRTPFSSVRNRAMEGVAEILRYPCRHGCGREVRLRRRAPHEASCEARRYHCPAPPCARHPPLPRDELAHHFQCKHLPLMKIGPKHKFSMKVNAEQHDTWLIMTQSEYFQLRIDVDIRTWGVVVYVAYIGPKRNAKYFTYQVTVESQYNSRKLIYSRSTHCDLESSSLNVSRQDCFHLTLDQALNFLRIKNRHCEPDKFLEFDLEITQLDSYDPEANEDSE